LLQPRAFQTQNASVHFAPGKECLLAVVQLGSCPDHELGGHLRQWIFGSDVA